MVHPASLAAADQEDKLLDQMLDHYIEGCRAIKREHPELDEVAVRAIQVALMGEICADVQRLHWIALVATAVSRLA